MQNDYEVILFDLGGVLLDLSDPVSTFGLEIDESDFLRTWILSPAVRALESGNIGAEDFARQIIDEMRLSIDWQELLRRFRGWPKGFYPKSVDVVGRIPTRFNCAILSNTNEIHWPETDVAGHFGERFDRCFLSYQSGLLKPDQAAFTQVIASYGCLPQKILFFDDNPINVDAAQNEGIASVRVEGPDQLEAALIDAGHYLGSFASSSSMRSCWA